MPRYFILNAYIFVLLYAALCYLSPDAVIMAIYGLDFVLFGLPSLLLRGLELMAPLLIAVNLGFCARWSLASSLLLGAPLVTLYSVVLPTEEKENVYSASWQPWLAQYAAFHGAVPPVVVERLEVWGCLFLLFVLIGLLSRLAPVGEGE